MLADLKELNILGIMSGTSLDGLDLAFCTFRRSRAIWTYKVLKAITLPYPAKITDSLKNTFKLSATDLFLLDHEYGRWIGNASKKFLNDNQLSADWIASHGHTVFHQPSKAFTLQIGNGNDIAAISGIPVVCDFRSLDVALGGQGAPLVPVGDEYLFGKYDFCLNLGGFSNISFKKNGKRIAFDICPVNMGSNYLAGKSGFDFDHNGETGRQGKVVPWILEKLNNLDFYRKNPPKSLSREWFIQQIEPVFCCDEDSKDIMRSFYEHISEQISIVLNKNEGENVLVTGGGAKNDFLMELISQKTDCKIVIPDTVLIDFKEALIFAFLGYLRVNNIPNVFSSVTGASKDHCGGVIIGN